MAQIATVTGVVGTVFAIAPNGTVRTLKVGDTLQQGEIVRTGPNARVELAMADGAATAATTATTATTAGAANGNVAIGSNAIVKVDDNMALGDARPTAQEAAVGIQAIQQVLQALEAGGDLTEELEAAAAGIAGGDGAGSDFVQLARVQLDTDSLSYAFDTAQGGSVELFETGTDVLPEITLGVVAVPDDAPTVQASTNAVLSEADLRVPESGSTVAVGTLVSFSAVPVVAGGTVASVSGSPETAGPGNRLRVVDPASGAQLVKVTNPTDQAMEFEWRDPSGTAYAKGLVASGEVVYLANDSYGGNRAMQLFVRLPGDSVWTGRNRGSLAVDDAESVDFVFPVAVEGVSFLGQLNFNAGADGGRITALSVESVAGLTSGGQPVVFTSTSSADGSTITLTGTAGGKVVLTVEVSTATGAYTATLLAPLDHPLADQSGATDPLNLELRYTVTDADGDAATGSFNVTVLDDAPVARDDAGGTLVEDGAVQTLAGNVLDNDTLGADGFGGFLWANSDNAAAIATLNQYGSLTLGANGAWSYTLDSAREATQALAADATIPVSLRYQVTDADGDARLAQLTLGISGSGEAATATATVTIPPKLVQVEEAGLLSAYNTSEVATGSFTVSATDGIASITVGGTTFSLAQLEALQDGGTPTEVDTGEGTLVLTGAAVTVINGLAVSADVDYTYTLKAALDHTRPGNDLLLQDVVPVAVVGLGGSTAEGSITVAIADDVPTVQPSAGATLDEHSLVPDGPSGTVVTGRLVDVGDVTVLAGAGLGSVTGSALTTGPGNTIRLIDPVTGHQMVQVKNPTGQAIDFEWRDNRASVGTVYAKGTVESGEVLFVSTTAHLGTPTIVLFARFAGVGEFVRAKGQGTLGGTSAATEDYPSPLPDPASPLDPGAGTSGLAPVHTTGQLNFNPGADGGRIAELSALAVGGLTAAGQPVEFVQTFLPGADGQPAGFVALTGSANGTPVLGVVVNAATGSYTVTLLAPLDHAPAEPGAGGSATPLKLELGYTVVDGDRDQADGTFVVTVLDGAGASKQLEATANSDTLTGTDGADVFRWMLADAIDPEAEIAPGILPPDTLLNFGESGADVLDLGDLLDNAGDVQFNVALDGDNTRVTVTGTKDADAFSQTIVLVNFSDGAAGSLVQAALKADGTYEYLAP